MFYYIIGLSRHACHAGSIVVKIEVTGLTSIHVLLESLFGFLPVPQTPIPTPGLLPKIKMFTFSVDLFSKFPCCDPAGRTQIDYAPSFSL